MVHLSHTEYSHSKSAASGTATSTATKAITTSDDAVTTNTLPPIPAVLLSGPCSMGIDEAGRGPVLGPMTYAAAICPLGRQQELRQLGIDDSKKITEAARERMLTRDMMVTCADWLTWTVRVLMPRDISRAMLRRDKYNLNTLSHDTAIELVRDALRRGIRVTELYVDTVGSPEKYQAMLSRLFPGIKCVVSKGADHLFPIVSAASIAAKVKRDAVLRDWKFHEPGMENINREFGSGYPGDPTTKRWLRDNIDPVFGFPEIIRFSWSTCSTLLEEEAVPVLWPEYDDDADGGGKYGKQAQKSGSSKRQRLDGASRQSASASLPRKHAFFKQLQMRIVVDL